MNMENTSCYAFFLVQSAGRLDYGKGFIPEENSAFDPDDITRILGIEPFEVVKFGTQKKNGKGAYNFFAWYGCKRTEPETSRFDQCTDIARELAPRIPENYQRKVQC